MLPLSSGELASMRRVQTDSMIDECVLVIYSNSGDNPIGEPTAGYSDGDTVKCSFNPVSNREVSEGSDVTVSDATIRLPMTVSLQPRDRVRITKIAHETLAEPLTYEVIGAPQHRKTTFVLDLRYIGAF